MDWNRTVQFQPFYTPEFDFDPILNLSRRFNISGGGTDFDITKYLEYQASTMIWRYLAPVILALGTIGSILSLLVLCRKSLRTQTTMFYLSALAIADLMVLYTGLVRLWLEHAEKTYIRHTSRTACKLHNFFVYLSNDLSVWILVAVTIDRCLYVTWPLSARKWCKLRNARIFLSSILCFSVLVNLHFFWTYDLEQSDSQQIYANGNKKCYAATSSSLTVSFVENVWPWIDFCVFCLFPFLLMATSNAIIIKQLIRTERNMASYQNVILGGRKGAMTKEPLGKRIRSSARMFSSSTNSSQRSICGSDVSARKLDKPSEEKKDKPKNDSFELSIMPNLQLAEHDEGFNEDVDTQQTESTDVVFTEVKFTSDLQNIGVSIKPAEKSNFFLDPEELLTPDVINSKPVNLETIAGSLEISPVNFRHSKMALCGETQRQGHRSPHRKIISIDIETHGGPHPVLVNRTLAESFPLNGKPEFTVEPENTDKIAAASEGISKPMEMFFLNEKTGNVTPSNVMACFHFEECDRSAIVTSEIQQPTEDQHMIKLAERKRPLINKVDPICDRCQGTICNTASLDDPGTPNTPNVSEVHTNLWTAPTNEKDRLVSDLKNGNRFMKHTFYEMSEKVKVNVKDISPLTNMNMLNSENDMNSGCCKEDNIISNAVVTSHCQLKDIVTNDKCEHSATSKSITHDLTIASKALPSSKTKWETMRTNSETQILASSRRNTSGVTKTLLAVTIMFWLFNAPVVIFIIGHTYFVASADGRGHATIILGWAIVNILQYMNNALHFFLYCLTGPKFRQELWDMFTSWIRIIKGLKDRRSK